jgi:hypothetical protein
VYRKRRSPDYLDGDFSPQRMGYLGLMILLDERQEVLMLVTNSLKMDLNNTKNMYIVGLALVALGNICSAGESAPSCPAPSASTCPYSCEAPMPGSRRGGGDARCSRSRPGPPPTEMARDLAPDVEKLMDCPAPYIRKKSALCAVRCGSLLGPPGVLGHGQGAWKGAGHSRALNDVLRLVLCGPLDRTLSALVSVLPPRVIGGWGARWQDK